MQFEHERIDANPPCGRLAFCLTSDLTGNGLPDVLVGGLGAQYELNVLGKRLHPRELPVVGAVIRQLEHNVFWYENPGWERHDIVQSADLSVGASLVDITGNGRLDLVVGQNQGSELFWFEQPPDPRSSWHRHLITDTFRKYHDTAIGDVDDDGEVELLVLSQKAETVCYFDIPDDPRQGPWPADHLHIVDEIDVEGAAIVDIDGDGRTEIIAGPNVYSRDGDYWTKRAFATEWKWTRVAVGDVDGDGMPEILLTEGDRPYHDGQPGRFGVFDGVTGELLFLDDSLINPHSLQLAEITDTGVPDVYVAEMGLGTNDEPRHLLYRNNGAGGFDRQVIHRGIPTHEARAVDLTGNGLIDIVGKSYTPTHHVDAWIQEP